MTITKKRNAVSTIHLRKLPLFGVLTYFPSVCVLFMSQLLIIHEIIQTCSNQSKNKIGTTLITFLSIGILNNALKL